MPIRYLCEQCLTLLDACSAVPAHSGLRPALDLGERWLYRCRHCGAFATAPRSHDERWSLNLLGQPLARADGDAERHDADQQHG
jgi:hypothetical protein